jgi:UPF0042 nucleotide-binding protein
MSVEDKKIFIITGQSGSGKSTAMRAFEDSGYYCVDNMPVALLPKFLELPMAEAPEIAGLAFVMDVREKQFIRSFREVFDALRKKGYRFSILYLEADDEVLIRRFSETRRQHPLREGMTETTLDASIREEKKQLAALRTAADETINTSHCNVHRLRAIIRDIIREAPDTMPLRVHVRSFGFKYGIPKDADLIIDVRFLPNPYFDPALRPLTGLDAAVATFILGHAETQGFMERYIALLDYLIPLYEKEGKTYLTIAVGCTGGRHRSVAIAEAISHHLRKPEKTVDITHRDIGQ